MTFFKHIITSSTIILSLGLSTQMAFAKFKVVTTFTVIQNMAQNVAGDAADVVSITKAGAEIHNYQPTPRDIVKAQKADMILWNGMNLELWFEKFFDNISDVPSIVVTEGIEPMSILDGPYSGKPNPHAWMSPNMGLIYVENIRKALVKHDPDNAATYNKNAKSYSQKLTQMHEPFKAKFDALNDNQKWLVSSEGAFSYLTRDYGLKQLFLWPINADQQGTPQQVRHVIDEMRAHDIGVIFSESTISNKPAKQVAKEVGAQYGGILYVDSLSQADGPVPTYFDLLNVTVQTIVTGLEATQ
ncbi:MAG: metal ABC transporter substrate-binding protein [Alphaproteobacteria bacterium]|nr:metal ABC transporter substrate-binding protein [Alphaproteobacteria bacterium]